MSAWLALEGMLLVSLGLALAGYINLSLLALGVAIAAGAYLLQSMMNEVLQ